MIAIHELGHFLMARWCKVEIEKFSIGFGAAILHFERGGVEYRLGWIPLGGFVKMKGENPDDPDTDMADAFQNQAWWKKILIAISGPLANLLLALILFIFAYLLPGQVEDHHAVIGKLSPYWQNTFALGDSIKAVNNEAVVGWYQALSKLNPESENSLNLKRGDASINVIVKGEELDSLYSGLQARVLPIVGDLQNGMPAWKAGLKTGDIVLAVDSVLVKDWFEMRKQIIGAKTPEIELTLQRGDGIFSRKMVLEQNFITENQPMIGITQYLPLRYKHSFTVSEAVRNGFVSTGTFIITYYKAMYHLIRKPNEIKSSLGGPVMIVSMSQQVGKKGLGYLILFFASVSLILMVMNLLPIPILDGGHILFAIIEGIIGVPIPQKVQGLLQKIGFILLIMLMVYAFYNDIMKLLMRAMNL